VFGFGAILVLAGRAAHLEAVGRRLVSPLYGDTIILQSRDGGQNEIVPNFLITGILAMIAGLLVTIWADAFIDRNYGARVLLLLAIVLFLVGGGFGPAFMAIIAALIATQINKPLLWWRTHLPSNLQNILVKLWPWALIAYLLFFASSVGIAIFGIPLVWFFSADSTYSILLSLGPISDVLLVGAILTAFAYDIQKQIDSTQASSTQGRLGQ